MTWIVPGWRCGSPLAVRGQMVHRSCTHREDSTVVKYSGRRLRVLRTAALQEHIDHALIDLVLHRFLGRRHAKERNQGARRAAMGSYNRVAVERRMPGADPLRDLLVGLAAGWSEQPLVVLARFDDVAVVREYVWIGQPLPFAEGDLGKAVIEHVASGRECERHAQD